MIISFIFYTFSIVLFLKKFDSEAIQNFHDHRYSMMVYYDGLYFYEGNVIPTRANVIITNSHNMQI